MKRLNNKGTTIVELLVCFSLMFVIMAGMVSIVFSLRSHSSDITFDNKMEDFKNNIVVVMEKDFIHNKFISYNDCSNTNLICYDLIFENIAKNIIIDKNNKIIRYDGIIYEIPNKNDIYIKDVLIDCSLGVFTLDVNIYKNNSDSLYNIRVVSAPNID